MVEWLKRLVEEGNAIRERSSTNWNTLDVDAIIAEKERQDAARSAQRSVGASRTKGSQG